MNIFRKILSSFREKKSTHSGVILFYTFLLLGTVLLARVAQADTTCTGIPVGFFTGAGGCGTGDSPYPSIPTTASLTANPTTVTPSQSSVLSEIINSAVTDYHYMYPQTYPESCEVYNITSGVTDTGQSFTPTETDNGYPTLKHSGSVSMTPSQTTTYGTSCVWIDGVSGGGGGIAVFTVYNVSQSPVVVTVNNQCTSPPNSCGQTQGGSCPQNTPPPNPPYYGQPCTSPQNACGMTNSGTYDCSNVCSATTPPNSQCSPATATLSANPTSYVAPGSSVLTYTSTNSTSCSINNGIGSVTPNVTGNVTVNPSATTNYTITCQGYAGDTPTASATVTVTQPTLPNLTAVGFLPTAVVAGQSYNFIGRIKNTGAATPSPFPSDIYVCSQTDANCISNLSLNFWQKLFASIVPLARAAAAIDIALNPLSLNANDNQVTQSTQPATFTTPGNYEAELCADTPVSNPPVAVTPGDVLCTPKQLFVVCPVGDKVGGSPAGCLPDLTASDVTPTTAIINTPVTLSATISDAYADTGGTFTDLFQMATDANGSNAVDLGTFSNSALSSGGTTQATLSHTFTTAGTVYLRACADKSSAGDAGVIAESNENNNCSADWVAVTIQSAGTVSCSPNPASGKGGDSITWSATSYGFTPTSYAWTDSNGAPQSGTNSTFTNTYSTDGSYSAHLVVQPGNVTADCAAVGIGCVGKPSGTLTANPLRVRKGTKTVLSWKSVIGDTNGVWTIQGTGGDTSSYPVGTIPASCAITDGQVTSNAINGQTQYCLEQGTTQVSCVTVNVIPSFNEY